MNARLSCVFYTCLLQTAAKDSVDALSEVPEEECRSRAEFWTIGQLRSGPGFLGTRSN